MKFKKRLLSEEVGLPKTNKQNYTKGKKQRVVLNEGQLQRLIKLINEKDKKPKALKPTPTKPNIKGGMSETDKFNPYDGPQRRIGEKPKGFGETPPARPNAGQKVPCPPGQIMTQYGCSSVEPNSKKEMEIKEQGVRGFNCEQGTCVAAIVGTPQYATLQDCQDANCEERARPTDDDRKHDGYGFDPDYPTSPLKRMCCRDRDGVITSAVNGRCPKSSTKVKCKGTPPTQGNQTSEGRNLKTTNPITESEIKDMKKWFNRVNKAGVEYNPSKK